jgi:hypothetical protein
MPQFCHGYQIGPDPGAEYWTKTSDVLGLTCHFELVEVSSATVLAGRGQTSPARFRTMDGIDALVLVYDVGDRASFDNMADVHRKLVEQSGVVGGVPVTLLGNVKDSSESVRRVVTQDEGRALAKQLQATFAECSVEDETAVRHLMWQCAREPAEARIFVFLEREEARINRLEVAKMLLVAARRRTKRRRKMIWLQSVVCIRKRRPPESPLAFTKLPEAPPTVSMTWEKWLTASYKRPSFDHLPGFGSETSNLIIRKSCNSD